MVDQDVHERVVPNRSFVYHNFRDMLPLSRRVNGKSIRLIESGFLKRYRQRLPLRLGVRREAERVAHVATPLLE